MKLFECTCWSSILLQIFTMPSYFKTLQGLTNPQITSFFIYNFTETGLCRVKLGNFPTPGYSCIYLCSSVT